MSPGAPPPLCWCREYPCVWSDQMQRQPRWHRYFYFHRTRPAAHAATLNNTRTQPAADAMDNYRNASRPAAHAATFEHPIGVGSLTDPDIFEDPWKSWGLASASVASARRVWNPEDPWKPFTFYLLKPWRPLKTFLKTLWRPRRHLFEFLKPRPQSTEAVKTTSFP